MGKIGDIWVRLGLKADDFKKGMSDAKKETQGLNASMGRMSGAVGAAGGALKGLAGAAGVALGAMETFDRLIKSNEANNDRWENTVRAMNNSVSEFFSALTSGDFTTFQDGLEGIVKKARETAEALRQIEDAQTVYGLFSTENRAIFNENMVTLRNKSANNEEINAAKKAIEGVIAKQTEESEVLADKALQAVQNIIAQRGNINAADITEADIKKMLSIALDRQGGLKDDALNQRYKEYEEAYENLRARYSDIDYTTGRVMFVGGGEYRKELEALNNQFADANLYNAIWNKVNGDELKQLVSFLQSAYAARSEIASMQRSYLRAGQSTDSGGQIPGTGGKASEPPAPSGSLAYLEEQLKKAQQDAASAVGEAAQVQAQATVRELEEQIAGMKFWLDTQVSLERGTFVPDMVGEIDIPEEQYNFNDKIDLKPTDIDVPELSSGMEDYTRNIYEASNAIGVLGGAMSNITGLVDSGAASWISYGTNVIQAIAQAIPAIASLTAAKSAEATANAASAATGAGSAVASIPYVGPIMAVAAIASVIAALANVPKFAEGGIVGGSSYYGDKILARLNSGELVLNRSQQAGLLGALDRPVQDVRLHGEFGISGRDLRLVLDKYDAYRRK